VAFGPDLDLNYLVNVVRDYEVAYAKKHPRKAKRREKQRKEWNEFLAATYERMHGPDWRNIIGKQMIEERKRRALYASECEMRTVTP
jgi:hypothetical protein